MNYYFARIVFVILAITFANLNHGFGEDKATGGVTIEKNRIIIHAGTKISKADEKKLNDVLKKYDKKLYQVAKFQNGKLTKSVGELKIDDQVISELCEGHTPGSTDYTIKTVTGANTQNLPPWGQPQKLIEELKPILEKYRKP
jgi:hypothetical protein